ncbi:MAG: DUF4349 domain-containing protein [Planctomycetota bacterium]|nr:DUF4349 domain-containing protein [Planctomycetota bacterium]
MRRISVLISLLGLLISAFGCSSVSKLEQAEYSPKRFGAETPSAPSLPTGEKEDSMINFLRNENGKEGGGEKAAETKRLIIYTATFSIGVYEIDSAVDRAKKSAEEVGGYVQEEGDNYVVLRVPAKSFWETVEKIRAIGRVIEKRVKAQDVTEEYLDLELRLKAKKEYLAALKELLSKAQNTEEILEVQRQIGAVIEEIESLEGRLRYLASKVAYSTILARFQLEYTRGERKLHLPFEWLYTLGIENLLKKF